MTAEEIAQKYFSPVLDTEYYYKLIDDIKNILHLKCKEIKKYYDTELEMLYEDDIISEKIFLQIKLNSPEPEI